MPIYEYEHLEGKGPGCSHRFEIFQKISEGSLTICPTCQKPCRRILSTFGVKSSSGILSKANLEAHGFTQYVKKGKGYYEKTAGVGPKGIAKSD